MAILKSSRHRQTAWNEFHHRLEKWCIFVDGLPARKRELFEMLYKEGERNQDLVLIQDCLADHFSVDKLIGGNVYEAVIHSITYQPRPEIVGYDPVKVEEQNVKSVLRCYTAKEVKKITGAIDMKQLSTILNNFAFSIYSEHEKISKEADNLYEKI